MGAGVFEGMTPLYNRFNPEGEPTINKIKTKTML